MCLLFQQSDGASKHWSQGNAYAMAEVAQWCFGYMQWLINNNSDLVGIFDKITIGVCCFVWLMICLGFLVFYDWFVSDKAKQFKHEEELDDSLNG